MGSGLQPLPPDAGLCGTGDAAHDIGLSDGCFQIGRNHGIKPFAPQFDRKFFGLVAGAVMNRDFFDGAHGGMGPGKMRAQCAGAHKARCEASGLAR